MTKEYIIDWKDAKNREAVIWLLSYRYLHYSHIGKKRWDYFIPNEISVTLMSGVYYSKGEAKGKQKHLLTAAQQETELLLRFSQLGYSVDSFYHNALMPHRIIPVSDESNKQLAVEYQNKNTKPIVIKTFLMRHKDKQQIKLTSAIVMAMKKESTDEDEDE